MRFKLSLTTEDGTLLKQWNLEDEQSTPSLEADYTYPLSVPSEAKYLVNEINNLIAGHNSPYKPTDDDEKAYLRGDLD